MTTATADTRAWVPELTFAARLALVRHAKSWNIQEAAAACGIPKSSWRHWEIDGHLPRRYIDACKQIAGVTGVDYLWLVDGSSGGDGGTTRQYFNDTRVVATIDPAAPSSRRPVRRTQPRPMASTRPRTAVAA